MGKIKQIYKILTGQRKPLSNADKLIKALKDGHRLFRRDWRNTYTNDVEQYIFVSETWNGLYGWTSDGKSIEYGLSIWDLECSEWFIWTGHHFNQSTDEIQLSAERAHRDMYEKRII